MTLHRARTVSPRARARPVPLSTLVLLQVCKYRLRYSLSGAGGAAARGQIEMIMALLPMALAVLLLAGTAAAPHARDQPAQLYGVQNWQKGGGGPLGLKWSAYRLVAIDASTGSHRSNHRRIPRAGLAWRSATEPRRSAGNAGGRCLQRD